MPWLTVERFVDVCGPMGRPWRQPFVAGGDEDELARTIADDPRRLVALVGEPGTGASRLALEIAQRFPRAWFPDPLTRSDPVADAAALAEALEASDDPALVVLDGPDPREALRPLAELLARPIHSRLHVLVPCAPAIARRLTWIAGGYPRGSILVAALGAEPEPPEPSREWVELLPLVLAGRLRDAAGWVERGVAAPDPATGEAVALIGDRQRRECIEREILEHHEGRGRLRAIADAHPDARAAIFETLLHVTDGAVPASVIPIACALDASHFPDPRSLFARGLPMSEAVARALVARGDALLSGDAPATDVGRVAAALAGMHRLLGDAEAEVAALERAVAADPGHATRLLVELAGATRDLGLASVVTSRAREEGDPDTLALALRQIVTLLHANEDREGARRACDEWIDLEVRSGRAAAAASARARAATLAEEAGDTEHALALMEAARADRRAVGDVRGQCFASYRIAGLSVELDRIEDAERAILDALALDEQVDDPGAVGYCRWMLGAMADKRGDARAAAEQYDASVSAYARAGRVPDRLAASLARAQAHAAGADVVPGGQPNSEEPGAGIGLPVPHDPRDATPLVAIRPKPPS